MSYLICVLIGVAAWHWVYESILAPSFRQSLKFEVESLRRAMLELRKSDSGWNAEVGALAECVEAVGATFETFDVMTVAAVEWELRRDPRLRASIEARRQMLEASGNTALQAVRKRVNRLAYRALAVNSGAWCIFILPVAVLRFGVAGLRRSVSKWVLLSGAGLRRMARA